jgi:hypothetical protein
MIIVLIKRPFPLNKHLVKLASHPIWRHMSAMTKLVIKLHIFVETYPANAIRNTMHVLIYQSRASSTKFNPKSSLAINFKNPSSRKLIKRLMICLISKTKFKLRSSIMLLFMDSQTKTKNFLICLTNKKSLENKFSNHSMKPLIRKIILLKQSLLTKILLNYGNRSISKSKRNHKNF